jgi:hypothetical protein
MVGAIKTVGDVVNVASDAFRSAVVSALSGTRQVTVEATTLISTRVTVAATTVRYDRRSERTKRDAARRAPAPLGESR